jgi:hypothetical protein
MSFIDIIFDSNWWELPNSSIDFAASTIDGIALLSN